MGGLDERDVIYEFIEMGNVVKVTAIDPDSGTEAAIVGASSATRQVLQHNALRKLKYVLAKRAGAA